MRMIAVLAVVISLALTGCIGGKHDLTVIVKLQCQDGVSCEWGDDTQGCRGLGGYSDLHDGMRITVRNSEGKVLASGAMEDFTGICSFRAELEVADADYYEIEAGNRSPYVVSKSELESNDWSIRLTLGDFS